MTINSCTMWILKLLRKLLSDQSEIHRGCVYQLCRNLLQSIFENEDFNIELNSRLIKHWRFSSIPAINLMVLSHLEDSRVWYDRWGFSTLRANNGEIRISAEHQPHGSQNITVHHYWPSEWWSPMAWGFTTQRTSNAAWYLMRYPPHAIALAWDCKHLH